MTFDPDIRCGIVHRDPIWVKLVSQDQVRVQGHMRKKLLKWTVLHRVRNFLLHWQVTTANFYGEKRAGMPVHRAC